MRKNLLCVKFDMSRSLTTGACIHAGPFALEA